VLQACECDARGRLGFDETAYPQAERLLKAQKASISVETAPIAQAAAAQGLKGPQIGAQIAQARIQAIARASL
jgi:tRNA nucleotidyltransferase (CCA-adding enzyme)